VVIKQVNHSTNYAIMSLTPDEMINALSVSIIKGGHPQTNILEDQRKMRLKEAVGWESGTPQDPKKYIVNTLPDGIEVYFLKPGKEVSRKKPNIYDLTPKVGESYANAQFSDIWIHLSRLSFIEFEPFKQIMVLIYRNAYHVDHRIIDADKVRYRPTENILRCIRLIESTHGYAFAPGGLLGLLNFLDVLGWNEDLKYHANKGGPPDYYNSKNFKAGRINTLTTCIKLASEVHRFVNDAIKNKEDLTKLDLSKIFGLCQQFSRGRGICAPTNKEILEWFPAYIREG